MKTSKSKALAQKSIIDQKLKGWMKLKEDMAPPSGWIKAIRGALGLSTGQLAKIVGVNQTTVLKSEEREALGNITLSKLNELAQAMDCKLIYAVVPNNDHNSLDDILNLRAEMLADQMLSDVEHSMSLEKQDVSFNKDKRDRLIKELKENLDKRLWEV
ncbi:MAG: hypothetical protein MK008_03345 [Bdellovibrionales bacterium]|nr:hypothetical protein [Bdellovibrionales bacterium]